MVLGSHIVLHLLLAPLELHLDLLVPLLVGFAVIALAGAEEIECLLPVRLRLVKVHLLILVVRLHFECSLAALLLRHLHSLLHHLVLLCAEHHELVAQRLVALPQRVDLDVE